MNKKVLSAILFSALFAGTGTFTSCIDNDEPAGIEELRGAKAELIRAKVAVEQAKAAHKLAQAEVELAKAAIKKAKADYEAAVAEGERLKNEYLEIVNDSIKAVVANKIAQAERDAELAAVKHDSAMYAAKQSVAVAQRKYEVALAQIETAKQTMPWMESVSFQALVDSANLAQIRVNAAMGALTTAKEDYDSATVVYKYKGEIQKKRLENAVAKKEANLKEKKEELAKWESFLEKDVETTDWRAEIDSLEALCQSLCKDTAELELQKARILASDEYKAYLDTIKLAGDLLDAEKDTLDNHFVMAEEVSDTLLYTVDADTVAHRDTVITVAKGAKKLTVINNLAGTNYIRLNSDSTDVVLANEYGGLIANLEAEIAGYTTEKKYWLDSIANVSDKTNAATLKASQDSIAAYKAAKTAYEAAKNISTDAIAKWADNEQPLDSLSSGAYKTFRTAIDKPGATSDDILKAKQAFADALVKFYKELPAAQVGLTQITLPVTTNGRVSYVNKTAQAWLEDATMKDVYLMDLISYFDGDTLALWGKNTNANGEKYETSGAVQAGTKLTGVFSKFNSKAEMLTALQTASRKAFGAADQYIGTLALPASMSQNGYLHTEPTAADVKAIDPNYDTTGAYGRYLLSLDQDIHYQAENYEAIIADLEAGKAKWIALVEELVAEAKVATAQVLSARNAITAANDAKTAYETANVSSITTQIEAIKGRKLRIEGVITALKSAVNTYLPTELKGSKEYAQGAQAFTELLSGLISNAEGEVKKAENQLANAQIALETYGKDDSAYNYLEDMKVAYEEAQADLDAAQAKLDKALANLETALKIFEATGSAE